MVGWVSMEELRWGFMAAGDGLEGGTGEIWDGMDEDGGWGWAGSGGFKISDNNP